ncbi:MAG: hypothetical protein Q7O66_07410 [Dehalococcoidia bacterium]|nr:hypothetical protein [Dehalococcoidia bacterium]
MIDLRNKSLTELQAMTKAQLIASILEGQTDIELEHSEDGQHGQVLRQHVIRDRATGNIIRRVRTTWTYHPNGDVADIATVETDAGGKELRSQTVRHPKSGGQPALMAVGLLAWVLTLLVP